MRRVFSVTQINSYIHRLFESDYALKKIYLKGEVSNCKYHSSGHIYFTLKDAKSALRCIMFSADRVKGLAFRLENGQQVTVCGNISVYEQAGSYQMYARQIEREGTGELYLEYEKRKQALAERGYFDFEKKKTLPAYPERIGIVTAPTGAAIEDIRSIARRRNPGVQLFLYPAKVQGEGAAAEIARGIRFLDTQGMDLLIIGRGGGSIEDLWAFNELVVADAIYEARTPIISGTGHEVDMTIADYCADVRAATPSAACELAIPDVQILYAKIDQLLESLEGEMERKLATCRERTLLLAQRLHAERPEQKLFMRRMATERLKEQLDLAMREKLRQRKQEYALYLERLCALAPTARLKGGYVFAHDALGHPVTSVKGIEKNRSFFLTFSDGEAEVVPVSVRKEEMPTGRKE